MAGLFIVGGSTYYTLLLLESLSRQGLSERFSTIALFGRDAGRLALIARAGSRLTEGTVPIITTQRFEDCLDPAYNIIFNQMRFGGLHARDTDEKIAIALGMPADETIGIVGVSNAIRTITGLAPFVDTLRRKQSDFTLVNFTNPCSIACQYMVGSLDARIIGVCDYPAFMRREIAATMNVAPRSVALDYFGLNHFGFIHGLRIDGRDALKDVMQARPSFMPACNRYFETLLNISWSFVFEAEKIVTRQQGQINRAATLLQLESLLNALLEAEEDDPAAYLALLAQRNCDWYDLAVSPVLAQLIGAPPEDVFVNCSAGDALLLGSGRTVIEGSATIRADDVIIRPLPETRHHLPEYQMVRSMKQAELTLLDGILAGDPDAVMASCMINPMIRTLGPAERYFTELRQTDPAINNFWSA